jgi:hypothetical protein
MDVATCTACGQPAPGRYCAACGRPTRLAAPSFAAGPPPSLADRLREANRLVVAGAVLGLVLALVLATVFTWSVVHESKPAIAKLPLAPERHTLSGVLAVTGRSGSYVGGDEECVAGTSSEYNGYDDIEVGAAVTVWNEKDTVIATSRLDAPTFEALGTSDFDRDYGTCTFPFTVEVPKAEFYAIEISHRGKLTFSYQELVSKNWRVETSLGS